MILQRPRGALWCEDCARRRWPGFPRRATIEGARQPGTYRAAGAPEFLASAPPDAGAVSDWLSLPNSGRYSPYPSASSRSTGMNRIAAEFMQ